MAFKMLLTVNLLVVLCSLAFACNDCPTYWTARGNHCYRYFGARVSWYDARHGCRTFGEGVDLVSIHSQQEQNFVYNYWKSLREADSDYPRPGMWIGLNDIEQDFNHEWSDNSPVNYRHFDRGQEDDPGDLYFLWDWQDSTWNPKGKWHNMTDRSDWYFQFMCKMTQETGKKLKVDDIDWSTI